jgi:hypothetical protein
MKTFTDLAPAPPDPPEPFTDRLRLAVAASPVSRAPPASTLNPISAATLHGPRSAAWIRWPPGGRISSSTSGGCKRSASGPPPCPGGSRSRRGSTGPACSMVSWSTHLPSTSAVLQSPPNHPPWVHSPAVRGAAHRRPPVTEAVRLRAGGHARPSRLANLRSHQRQHR